MRDDEALANLLSNSLFVWLWHVVNDRKFSARTVFFSHINQPAVLLHEPATKRTSQPNMLTVSPIAVIVFVRFIVPFVEAV